MSHRKLLDESGSIVGEEEHHIPNTHNQVQAHFKSGIHQFVRLSRQIKPQSHKVCQKKPDSQSSMFYQTTESSRHNPLESQETDQHQLESTLQSLLYVSRLTKPQPATRLRLNCDATSKLLIFDLDETLVNCTEFTEGYSKLRVKSTEGQIMTASLSVRPHTVECLRKLSSHYEIGIFTASCPQYADAVI